MRKAAGLQPPVRLSVAQATGTAPAAENAIGYASLAAIKDSVKALTVNGVAPTEATVKDGTYLVQRPFVLVTKEGTALSDTAQKFFDFAISADAASIISAAGAVPVCRMAGMPETIRYTLMSSTHPTVMRPRSKNTPCTTVSRA